MVEIINNSVCRGVAGRRANPTPSGVVIHNTADNATAKQHMNRLASMSSTQLENGFAHYFIDENTVIRTEDTFNMAWHTANPDGNANYVGYEVCRSTGDQNTFLQAEQNTFKQVAQDLKEWELPANINTVRLHKEFSATACPHRSSELHGKTIDAVKDYFISQINKYMQGTHPQPPVDDNKVISVSGDKYMDQRLNQGAKVDFKLYKAVIKDIPSEKMAKEMSEFTRQNTKADLLAGNVFTVEYPNRLMLKITGLTKKRADGWKPEIIRLTQGQVPNYDGKNVRIVKQSGVDYYWIEVDKLPKDWQAVNKRLRQNIQERFAVELLDKRVFYSKQSNDKYYLEVNNLEDNERAKMIVDKLRRWFPSKNNAYSDAVAVLQY